MVDLFEYGAAVAARDAGIASVEANTPDDWASRCDSAIEKMARSGLTFTAEDIREQVGDPPNHPNAMGARFMAARRRGLVSLSGYVQGGRKEAHARLLRQYTGRDCSVLA